MRKVVYYGLVIGSFMAVVMAIIIINVSRTLPDVNSISTYVPLETTKIYSDDGIILAQLHEEENRMVIPLSEISPTIKDTVVAIEDREFYSHPGINIQGIFRALFRDIIAGSFVEGGSTLTQQLARNLFLKKQKKISRKIAEAILAIQMERKYSKQEILEMYLNQVYWGHNAYGIESASLQYFGKHASEINIPQAAMLVGILSGPELYSPFRNFELAKSRQEIVLNRMVELGKISKIDADRYKRQDLEIANRRMLRYKAPYFTEYIVQQLIERYGEQAAYTSGMRVYTSLNYDMQRKAETVVKKYVDMGQSIQQTQSGKPVPNLHFDQGALLAMDPRTGYILAMQGGTDFRVSAFNRTIQAKRQPGSAFKPFVYLAGLEKGMTSSTIIDDSPITFNTGNGTYSPQNYTQEYLGPIPLRKALELSINIVAIKITNIVGPKYVINVARRLGLKSPLLPVLSLPLGANETTMLEMTSVYGVLANNGVRVEPVSIVRIEDRNGVPLYKSRFEEKRVFDPDLIATLVDMMKGVVDYGTGKAAKLPRPMAGKTGTTSDYRDAWFIGFVPQMVTATWVGNDNYTPMNGVTGGWIPAMMWKDFMMYALRSTPPREFMAAGGATPHHDNWETGTPKREIYLDDAAPALETHDNGETTENAVPVTPTKAPAEPVRQTEAPRAATPGTAPVSAHSEPAETQDQKIMEFFNPR